MDKGIIGLGIQQDELGRYLADQNAGIGALRQVTKFGTGQSNPTYLLDTDKGRFVLRTKPPGPLLPSAHLVDREYDTGPILAQYRCDILAGDTPQSLADRIHALEHAHYPDVVASWVEGWTGT